MPTVYIISRSTNLDTTSPSPAQAAYNSAIAEIPRHTTHLETVECASFRYREPSRHRPAIRRSSSLDSVHRGQVMHDENARNAVDEAIFRVMGSVEVGVKNIFFEVTCQDGKGRSVCVAEVLREELQGMGVRVVVSHPERDSLSYSAEGWSKV